MTFELRLLWGQLAGVIVGCTPVVLLTQSVGWTLLASFTGQIVGGLLATRRG